MAASTALRSPLSLLGARMAVVLTCLVAACLVVAQRADAVVGPSCPASAVTVDPSCFEGGDGNLGGRRAAHGLEHDAGAQGRHSRRDRRQRRRCSPTAASSRSPTAGASFRASATPVEVRRAARGDRDRAGAVEHRRPAEPDLPVRGVPDARATRATRRSTSSSTRSRRRGRTPTARSSLSAAPATSWSPTTARAARSSSASASGSATRRPRRRMPAGTRSTSRRACRPARRSVAATTAR